MNAIRMNVLRSLSTITMYTHLRASIPIAIDSSEEPSMTTLKCKQIVFPNINSMTIAQFIIISFLSSPFTARFHFDFVCLAMYYDHVKRQQIFVSFFSVLFAFILCNNKKRREKNPFWSLYKLPTYRRYTRAQFFAILQSLQYSFFLLLFSIPLNEKHSQTMQS